MPQSQKLISEAYESIGRETDALVVPVGDAWRRFIAKHESPALHDKDQSHPTLAGSYLAACVFLKTLFDKSAAGIESKLKGLSENDVQLLQRAAERG